MRGRAGGPEFLESDYLERPARAKRGQVKCSPMRDAKAGAQINCPRITPPANCYGPPKPTLRVCAARSLSKSNVSKPRLEIYVVSERQLISVTVY